MLTAAGRSRSFLNLVGRRPSDAFIAENIPEATVLEIPTRPAFDYEAIAEDEASDTPVTPRPPSAYAFPQRRSSLRPRSASLKPEEGDTDLLTILDFLPDLEESRVARNVVSASPLLPPVPDNEPQQYSPRHMNLSEALLVVAPAPAAPIRVLPVQRTGESPPLEDAAVAFDGHGSLTPQSTPTLENHSHEESSRFGTPEPTTPVSASAHSLALADFPMPPASSASPAATASSASDSASATAPASPLSKRVPGINHTLLESSPSLPESPTLGFDFEGPTPKLAARYTRQRPLGVTLGTSSLSTAPSTVSLAGSEVEYEAQAVVAQAVRIPVGVPASPPSLSPVRETSSQSDYGSLPPTPEAQTRPAYLIPATHLAAPIDHRATVYHSLPSTPDPTATGAAIGGELNVTPPTPDLESCSPMTPRATTFQQAVVAAATAALAASPAPDYWITAPTSPSDMSPPLGSAAATPRALSPETATPVAAAASPRALPQPLSLSRSIRRSQSSLRMSPPSFPPPARELPCTPAYPRKQFSKSVTSLALTSCMGNGSPLTSPRGVPLPLPSPRAVSFSQSVTSLGFVPDGVSSPPRREFQLPRASGGAMTSFSRSTTSLLSSTVAERVERPLPGVPVEYVPVKAATLAEPMAPPPPIPATTAAATVAPKTPTKGPHASLAPTPSPASSKSSLSSRESPEPTLGEFMGMLRNIKREGGGMSLRDAVRKAERNSGFFQVQQ